MKLQLIISDATASELANILAALGSSTAIAVVPQPTAAATTDDEDDGDTANDTAVAPGTLDKNGLPWDDRIHSTPAALTDKGVWRAKRGVGKDKALVAAVEAELRARVAAPVPVPVPHPQPVYATQPQTLPNPVTGQPVYDPNAANPAHQHGVTDPGHGYQPAPVQPQYQPQPVQQPQAQPVPVYQPAPVAAVQPQPGQYDFNAFMQKIQQLLQMRDPSGAPLIDAGYLNNVSARVGIAFQQPVNAVTDLSQNQAMIDYAIGMMFAEQKWL